MLTAHSEKGRLIEAYDAGVDNFVAKPFDHEELLARVRSGIRAAKLHDDLVRKATGSQALNAQLATLNSRLERLSITDELTGLFNRRHALSRLEEQWEMSQRYGRSLTVAMIDIDHFKNINDRNGHAVGDAILRRIAGILRDQTRGTDVVCRVGGEEFLLVFPSQSIQEAGVCAERCRSAIAKHIFNVGGLDLRATVSIGLASHMRAMREYPELLEAADKALYAAKNGGRNMICRADQGDAPPAPQPAAASLAPLPMPTVQTTREAVGTPIDRAAVLARCGGDPAFATAVIERFRSQAPGEAAKCYAAFTGNDADTLRRTAHSLKSMSAYMSAANATSLAAKIEEFASKNQLASAGPLIAQLQAEIDYAVKWLNDNSQNATRCA
jgi:diguanylate cyclase (GGDEF)-like protein